jgi:hypothetical protein
LEAKRGSFDREAILLAAAHTPGQSGATAEP